MAIVTTDSKHYNDIARAIQEKTGGTDTYKPGEMADGVGAVYEAGKQAEYDAFWDAFQENGARTEYRYAFAYAPWTDVNFKPKYPLKVVGEATYMFVGTTFEWADKVLEVDFSEATSVLWSFRNNRMHHIGKCDFSSVIGNVHQTFSMCTNLQSIEEIVSYEGLGWDAPFALSTKLETLKISGVIGKNGFDVSPCPLLTHGSLMSILNALKDYSGSGSTHSVTLGATNLAKLTDAEKQIATQKGWTLA